MENRLKERFRQLAKSCGFANFHQVSVATGIEPGNLYSNLSGRFDPSVRRLFVIANTLKVPVTELLDIFYEEEMKQNQRICDMQKGVA